MKVFIAGPIAIKKLDNDVLKKLDNICKKKYDILIGDASGVDSAVQQYLKSKKYKDVSVYTSNVIVRNNIGKWNVIDVPVDNKLKGFDFHIQKDNQMVKDADIGFMIWNGESRGTFNNIINLLNQNKNVILYLTTNNNFYMFKIKEEFEKFIKLNITLNDKLKKLLKANKEIDFKQVSWF